MIYDIIEVLRGRALQEREYILKWYQRWFYTLKAVACIVLSRDPKLPDWSITLDHITVAILDSQRLYIPGEPTIYNYHAIVVGVGVFSNWWYCYHFDGS